MDMITSITEGVADLNEEKDAMKRRRGRRRNRREEDGEGGY